MTFGGKPNFWLSLCSICSFVGYLFAGASFALPPKQAGQHCAMTHGQTHASAHAKEAGHGEKPHAVSPGASCPLASHLEHHHADADSSAQHGHDCDACHGSQSATQIVVCPQGCCLLHPEGGEVTSIAKFLLSPKLVPAFHSTLERVPLAVTAQAPEPFLAPPPHPPSVPLFV